MQCNRLHIKILTIKKKISRKEDPLRWLENDLRKGKMGTVGSKRAERWGHWCVPAGEGKLTGL